MSTRTRRIDSASEDTPTTAIDIEAIVKKAVEAATVVIRNEFTKLLKELTDRVRDLEASMNDCSSRVFTAANLEERITALEAAHERQDDVYSSSTQIEAVRQESPEAKVWANDNEQYSRRNNVRIRGLDVKKDDNCKQSVAKFCREKLHIQGIDSADIDVAHLVVRQQNGSAEASTQKAPTVLVRFYRREHRDLVIRQRRQLKGTGLTVIEDLTNLNVETFNRARNSPLVDKSWTWNGKVYGLLKSGKKVWIKPYQAIQDCDEA